MTCLCAMYESCATCETSRDAYAERNARECAALQASGAWDRDAGKPILVSDQFLAWLKRGPGVQEQYISQRILVDAAFAAAVEEDGFVTAYPPVGK